MLMDPVRNKVLGRDKIHGARPSSPRRRQLRPRMLSATEKPSAHPVLGASARPLQLRLPGAKGGTTMGAPTPKMSLFAMIFSRLLKKHSANWFCFWEGQCFSIECWEMLKAADAQDTGK